MAEQKVKKRDSGEKVSAKAAAKEKVVQINEKKGGVTMAEGKAGKTAVEEKKEAGVSSKSRLVALLLSFFLGWAGGHRFYANKIGTGILMLFTMGGFGMWYFLDFIMIATGTFKDKDNLAIKNWA
jgi:hypothetical protein